MSAVGGLVGGAAGEGSRLGPERLGELFEQFVGLELIRMCRLHKPSAKLRFWRDPDGPEVDWVVEHKGIYLPIEVKWSERPRSADARHLRVFLDEHPKEAEYYRAQIALGYFGDPLADVAPVAVFLASEASRYVSGQTINVDGGMVML